MAHAIGYVDDTGSEGSAHWQMLDFIRRFACGYGTLATPAFTGTGNGTLGSLDTHPATVTETWTLTCTDATTAGAETWSVVGSVSGAQANATTGVAYTCDYLDFLITAGATAFVVNDAFTIAAIQGDMAATGKAWTQLRYDTAAPSDTRELILKGVGNSGSEEIYVGLRTYQSVSADYYNMSLAVFSGYVAANVWNSQPGRGEVSICAHNLRIDYWLAVNPQRILLGMKLGTPVYEIGYIGKFLPYATPGQYPYPVTVIGTLTGSMPATRFSDTSSNHSCGAHGTGWGYIRDVMSAWDRFSCAPWNGLAAVRRDTGGYHTLMKCVLLTSGNVWGELDGINYISGFDLLTEDTTTIDGIEYVVLQDVFRNGFSNYFALELD